MHYKNYEEQLRLLNDLITGKDVSQLELALAGINADIKEVAVWREIARLRRKQSSDINKWTSKALNQVTFNTKG